VKRRAVVAAGGADGRTSSAFFLTEPGAIWYTLPAI